MLKLTFVINKLFLYIYIYSVLGLGLELGLSSRPHNHSIQLCSVVFPENSLHEQVQKSKHSQWCLFLLQKSTVKQTRKQTVGTQSSGEYLLLFVCGLLQKQLHHPSHIHMSVLSWLAWSTCFSFSLFHLWHVVGICLRTQVTNYFETKEINMDWCWLILEHCLFCRSSCKEPVASGWSGVIIFILAILTSIESLRAGHFLHFLDSSLSDVLHCGQINVPTPFPTIDQEFINLTPAFKWPLPTWFSTNPSEQAVQWVPVGFTLSFHIISNSLCISSSPSFLLC